MNAAGVPADRAEWAAQAAALVLTTAFVTLAVLAPIAPPPPAVDARKSAQVTLSVVEEAPPTPTDLDLFALETGLRAQAEDNVRLESVTS